MNVRVLMLEAPQDLLDERARKGLDTRDEMWDGVLHMVPPPQFRHQVIERHLLVVLHEIARARGLEVLHQTGLFRPGRNDDYRVPDLAIFAEPVTSTRGLEGAAHAVIEIRSPGDESYEKIGFYLDVGVGEVVIVDRDTLTVEVFRTLDEQGRPVPAGDTTLAALDVTFERVDDQLRLTWMGGEADLRV